MRIAAIQLFFAVAWLPSALTVAAPFNSHSLVVLQVGDGSGALGSIYSGSRQWRDMPANYHNGACGFSFADGHAEIKRWLNPFTRNQPVLRNSSRFASPLSIPAGEGDEDLRWVADRSSYKN